MILMLLVWVLAAVALAFLIGGAVRIAERREHRDLYLDDILAVAHRAESPDRGAARR